MADLGLGTAGLGNVFEEIDDEAAAEVIAAAADAGIRYFDTAPYYGFGLAERRLGRALARLPAGSFTVSTKVGRTLTGEGCVFDFSADAIRRGIEGSLDRLGLDRVDIVYLHDPDDHEEQAANEAWPELCRLRDEGVVAAIGVGMNQWEMPARFVERLDVDVVLLAGRYTLLDRSGERLLDLCGERGVDVVLGGVFNSGLLIDPRPGVWFDYAPAPADLLARARAMREVAASAGYDLAACALAFAAAHPAVTSVLAGVTSAAQLRANLDAFRREVPSELLLRLISG
ncbi:oxidoreductase [Amycolatopsis mediterranei S699]|uniref:Oxidoreductase n=2 Tax=Amycolatopsis mediterranei TaxID=33910 RepID=A0A0H3D5R5_AMYMU|nr:aldo/keto reductase [Amycolatopsis mediterranei]ADJ44883.1 oxidoreductase [Amycolatopsis mediterranei U32]AEK41633.1 oxidoreductase [Amycolatopsis mediterranei S699]AFO76594.1 oxidoreductase [Amycolatopsis mediterranei S699]AGT83723.1 oxidoreductase [Amycolatopsis mediterranei RB]KDO07291.1 aldo/keto reductase [Amycolatopsis mediterranei]